VKNWSQQDVSKWLNSVGLGTYSEACLELDVDGEILLMDLDEDLLVNEIGMTASHAKFVMNWVEAINNNRKPRVETLIPKESRPPPKPAAPPVQNQSRIIQKPVALPPSPVSVESSAQYQKLLKQNDDLKKSIQTLTIDKVKLMTESQTLKQRASEYQSKLADSETKNLKYNSEVSKQQKTIESLSTRMAKMISDKQSANELKAQLAQVKNEKLITSQLLQDKTKAERELKQTLSKLETQCDSIKKENKELKLKQSNLAGAESTKLQEVETRHQEQLQRLITALQGSKQDYANLETMHNVMIEELQAEVKEREEIIEEMETKELSHVKENKRLRNVEVEMQEQISSYEQQLNQWQSMEKELQMKEQSHSDELRKMVEKQNQMKEQQNSSLNMKLMEKNEEIMWRKRREEKSIYVFNKTHKYNVIIFIKNLILPRENN